MVLDYSSASFALRAPGRGFSWSLLWNAVCSVMLGMWNLLLMTNLEHFSVRPACNCKEIDGQKWWLFGSGPWFETGKFYCSFPLCMRMFYKIFSTFVCWLQFIASLWARLRNFGQGFMVDFGSYCAFVVIFELLLCLARIWFNLSIYCCSGLSLYDTGICPEHKITLAFLRRWEQVLPPVLASILLGFCYWNLPSWILWSTVVQLL